MTQEPNDPKTNDTTEGKAGDWWGTAVTRREFNTATAGAAALLGLSGVSALSGCCGDDGADEGIESASLDAQMIHGWNVGDEKATLVLNDIKKADSEGKTDWTQYLKPAEMVKVLRPTQKEWRPFERLTLVQSLAQESLSTQVKPIFTAKMQAAQVRGAALSSLLKSSKGMASTLLIIDMPGPQSVALAASMAESVEPVFFFDNWPHPAGVVSSHQTLASLLFFANAFKEARAKREFKALPVALVLDNQRLSAYSDSSDKFDNRYIAELPEADKLKRLGIERVLYVTETKQKDELDDLNDYFVDFDKQKIAINHLNMDAFQKDSKAPTESATGGYYYGGSHHHHTYFYRHYPMFIYIPYPSYGYWRSPATATAPSRVKAPSYKPTARKTMFSGKTTGLTKGVGSRKPTGFGRVSTRVNSSGKAVRSRARSGSFGRARGGGGS